MTQIELGLIDEKLKDEKKICISSQEQTFYKFRLIILKDQKYSGDCISRPSQFRMDQIVQQSADNSTLRVDGACPRHIATH